MEQNIVRLPETAEINIDNSWLIIENHKVKKGMQLFIWMQGLAKNEEQYETLDEFEKWGITYEAFIEQCVMELEEDSVVFQTMENWEYCDNYTNDRVRLDVANTPAAAEIISDMVDHIRDCNDWEDFFELINPESDFSTYIAEELKFEARKCIENRT